MTHLKVIALLSMSCLLSGIILKVPVMHARLLKPTEKSQSKAIAILYDTKNATSRFTADEMKKNLQAKGYEVALAGIIERDKVNAGTRFVLTLRDTEEAVRLLKDASDKALPPLSAQGYSIRKTVKAGYTEWHIVGNDKCGLIYGGLDAGETVKLKGINSLAEVDKQPYIRNRGIKFNIPLDARTPSYSDNSDAAQQNIADMWDIRFWEEFLDEMARDRFNVLSLWSLSPFPSLVHVPEYPNAGLNDVKKTTGKLLPTTDALFMSTPSSLARLVTVKQISLSEKIEFWKKVMQYASDRGIDCYLFTWNLFVYGTENSGYEFTDKITDEKTKDYIRKATKALIKTYPLLKGIGLTAGENMFRQKEEAKEEFLYESYGQGINDALAEDATRTLRLIHRAHQADINMIKSKFNGLNARCTLNFSYKYSVAQMYSSVAPKYIYESKFLEHIGDSKFFLTVRDDAWYNLRGGSDPSFARQYFTNIPKKNFEGFYVGPDGYNWGRDYLTKLPANKQQLVLDKRWYSFQVLGKLSYDPTIPDDHFVDLLKDRFPEADASKTANAWAIASRVMTWVNRFHNERSQNDFQWYPEACTSFYGFRSIDNFISCGPQKGEGMLSIPEYSNLVLNKKSVTGISPIDVADSLQQLSDQALKLIKGAANYRDRELMQTVGDIRAMAYLGSYYANKIRGAVNKDLFMKAGSSEDAKTYRSAAITHLKKASDSWKSYAAEITAANHPQHLTRMHFTVDFKAIQAHVDKEVAVMSAQLSDSGLIKTRPIQQLEVVFSDHSNYYFWHLDKLGLPADWSSFKYVMLEVMPTSKQPFDLVLQAGNDTLVKTNVTAIPMKWNRVIVPIAAFVKTVPARKDKGNGYAQVNDPVISKTEMLGIGVFISKPVGYPVLEIRSIRLLKEQTDQLSYLPPAVITIK